MITFFDIRGIVCYTFVPPGQVYNQMYYLEVLQRLYEKVRCKQPELFTNNSWLVHHDNAPAHIGLSIWHLLARKQMTYVDHPSYSPDLAPDDFFLYSKIKEVLK